MTQALRLGKFSIGMGDRFAHQAAAQLQACHLAAAAGVELVPVWNKSNREHLIIGSEPASVRHSAAAAVQGLGWTRPWHVDADHIRLETVDRFLEASDFFTLDVADSIGREAPEQQIKDFVKRHPELIGTLEMPGVEPCVSTREQVTAVARKFLLAVQEAGVLYRHIAERKGAACFIPEISMDETDAPQTPLDLLIILAAIADEQIPIQTIAPKFTGRFNKGVDYMGDVEQFAREFNDDLCVLRYAVRLYGLPENLKLSVHSGSDKFSIYPAIRQALQRHQAGLHVKTAGTSWLEELIGLAEAGGEALAMAKSIYHTALEHKEELCGPYATVIDIQEAKLPHPATVAAWNSAEYVGALRHDPKHPLYNAHLRQLLHVAFKIAAQKGAAYLALLKEHQAVIAHNVTQNLWVRHIRPLFLD